ncbi:Dolichyl-phosphate-mannose-protein mannosyltransferase [Posidoniimonas corsicana]|uniref:Dolichyl-phosphate-mannose-protein mannosyltransferase n=1 Tax=Posidoniimonas corsicana TaxID=1938618 RepID=A0A5C5VHK6_9BACT|nr:glycosyltransferase family 39 protein [Posidoniimonas corsicana]TWT37162.1 Dolichyl-phosphate-mannose-protein mannosyltransferase [Posidoniimonas corsicana]
MSSLQASFHCLAQLLDKPRIAWRVVLGLLIVHTGLLMYSAFVHSPTLNEPGHLVAGLSHWKFGRFELYRVNPPLVRMVAALPVIAVGYEEDWSGFYDGPGARPVFGMGEDFVAANGPRTLYLTMIARWACIPFSWLGAIVCYLWGRDLYSRSAGLVACFIWCFEPNILAHASLITADAHATALGLAACYTFWRWLKKPTWVQAALTGVVLGLAELAKTTLILFYPLWPLLWLAYRWQDRAAMTARAWAREAGMLAIRMAIGLYVVNLGYGFEGSFTQLNQFQFVSNLFTGEAPPAPETRISNPAPTTRFSNTWVGELPVPVPKNYLLGIDIQQKAFERNGRPSYLRGEWRNNGWWYYYLYAGLIKVPVAALLLAFLAAMLWLKQRVAPTADRTLPKAPRDELVLLFPTLLIFCVVSSKTGFSEHFRYALPAFPFLFIWIGGIFRDSDRNSLHTEFDRAKEYALITSRAARRLRVPLRWITPAVMLAWLSASSLWIYPHSLSYFNETVGGPLNGAKHLLGSNLDWGQDYYYLESWCVTNPDLRLDLTENAVTYHPADCFIAISNATSYSLLCDLKDVAVLRVLNASAITRLNILSETGTEPRNRRRGRALRSQTGYGLTVLAPWSATGEYGIAD